MNYVRSKDAQKQLYAKVPKGGCPLSRFCPRTLTYVKVINVRKNEILRAQLGALTLRCPISNAAFFSRLLRALYARIRT